MAAKTLVEIADHEAGDAGIRGAATATPRASPTAPFHPASRPKLQPRALSPIILADGAGLSQAPQSIDGHRRLAKPAPEQDERRSEPHRLFRRHYLLRG
ncbi:hypothetical protein [Roseicella aerolata]|uniref:Uncharacterized protein n=1 Tax=Roseicella aerolata TaxID=2883479 RepID=A0A9X1IKS5_9PROT|nr:hypothetical protein [Roseicella aerolata]MCB4825438.1 hypothetical protein [Roseicella aerolata]